MAMFISKALRRAEVFLEQVDEGVAQVSRRLAVDSATDAVHTDDDEDGEEGEEETEVKKESNIPEPDVQTHTSTHQVENAPSSTSISEAAHIAKPSIHNTSAPNSLHVPDASLQRPDTQASVQKESAEEPSGKSLPPADAANAATRSAAAVDVREATPQPAGRGSANGPAAGNPGISSSTASGSNVRTVVENSVVGAGAGAFVDAAKFLFGPDTASSEDEASDSLLSATPSMNSDVSSLTSENASLREALGTSRESCEKLRRERAKLVKNLKRMKEIVSEMDESLREKSADARHLEDELVAAREEAIALRNAQEKALANANAARDALVKERDAAREEARVARADAEHRMRELDALREQLTVAHSRETSATQGAREDATQARQAYETEAKAHRETRAAADKRAAALEAASANAAAALAAAQRKADDCSVDAANARAELRAVEAKRVAAENAQMEMASRLEMWEREREGSADAQEDTGAAQLREELEAMQVTVSELEHALETKNVELKRLEGAADALRTALEAGAMSPRNAESAVAKTQDFADAEQKLRHMADASLRKQAQLEVARSENRALKHQLETERKRTREAQAMAAASSAARQSIRGGFRGILEVGDEERGARAYGIRDGPLSRFRAPRSWPRSLVRAVGALDQVSAQALGVLRREPIIRIVLLIYTVCMHIFVWSLLHYHTVAVTNSEHAGHVRGGPVQ